MACGIQSGLAAYFAYPWAVIGGLTASTLITLFLAPIVYLGATRSTMRLRTWSRAFLEQLRQKPVTE